MKYVWILRHGKAASKGTDGDDHSRPLTGRGRRQSTEVAAFLADQVASGAPTPNVVLTSSAARALATAEAAHDALGDGVPLEIGRALYGADADDIVNRLRLVPDEIGAVMVVGHNPTFQDLALLLVSPDDTDGRARLEEGFPTAALALVALEADHWSEVVPGHGHLEIFFAPTAH
jgi:phosphohistidine phosphatase